MSTSNAQPIQQTSYRRRFDYVRITIFGTPSEVINQVGEWTVTYESFGSPVHGRAKGKQTKSYNAMGSDATLWYKTFECWGEAADAFAHALPQALWAQVTRCDWREEIPTPPLSLDQMKVRAKRYCPSGMRVTTDESRLRSRRNGRDGGGELLGIGSHASDTRLTVYKRGWAEWAVEAQISGKQLSAIVAEARHEHSQDPHEPMYNIMQKVMFRKLRTLVQQRLAMPFEELAGREGVENTTAIQSCLTLDDGALREEVYALMETAGRARTLKIMYDYYREVWLENTDQGYPRTNIDVAEEEEPISIEIM